MKRARFNSSLLDLNSLRKGSDYEQLPESYVIFITENDVWQRGLARYHVNRIIEELNQPFEDGSHIIYVNGNYKGTDDIGRLMNDFRSENVEDMLLEPLKETVHRYKTTRRRWLLCAQNLKNGALKNGRQGRQAGLQAGRQEGRQEGENRLTTLLKLLKADDRLQDLELAIDDEKTREKFYQEYRIH